MIPKPNLEKVNENTKRFLDHLNYIPIERTMYPEWRTFFLDKANYTYKFIIDESTIEASKYNNTTVDIPKEEFISSYVNPEYAAKDINRIILSETNIKRDVFENNETTNIETFFNQVEKNTPTDLKTEKTIDALIASNGVVYSTDNNKTFTLSQMSSDNFNEKVELLWTIAAQILHETFDDYFQKIPQSDRLKINISISETE